MIRAGHQQTTGVSTLGYDAENRIVSEQNSIGRPSATYAYDGDERRVHKTLVNQGTMVYVYDVFGQLAAEYATSAQVLAALPAT